MSAAAARRLRGCFAPVVTPFAAWPGEVDLAAFRGNAVSLLDAGVDGLVLAGSTGEAALLDDAERRLLLEAARAVVPADRWLIAGCGAESTRQTVQRCRTARVAGADSVLVVAPHYYTAAMTPEALRAHYRRVADESPIPVILYNIPKYMHFAIPAELVAELAAHDNVIGIKDSSGDLALLDAYLASSGPTFGVLTGNGGQLHEAMRRGARGGILAVCDFAWPLVQRIRDAVELGDHAAADTAQGPLAVLAKQIVAEGGVPAIKAAMDAVGLAGGLVRAPLLDLDAAGRTAVTKLVREAGL